MLYNVTLCLILTQRSLCPNCTAGGCGFKVLVSNMERDLPRIFWGALEIYTL